MSAGSRQAVQVLDRYRQALERSEVEAFVKCRIGKRRRRRGSLRHPELVGAERFVTIGRGLSHEVRGTYPTLSKGRA